MRIGLTKRSFGALTILEMLVSVALLSFIILGLTAMFIQTQKAFKTGIKQVDSTDAGRAVIEMVAGDIAQMTDPHFVNVTFPEYTPQQAVPLPAPPPTLWWSYSPNFLFQIFTNVDNQKVVQVTNELEDIYMTVQTNMNWLGIGYTVSNWFTNGTGGTLPGVGTLYRFVITNVGPLFYTNTLFSTYANYVGFGTYTNTYFHRIADGVVHLKIRAFDADGNEMYWEPWYDSGPTAGPSMPNQGAYVTGLQYPEIAYNSAGNLQTNFLPHSIDIEMGILEPEAFEHVRSLYAAGAYAAAGLYLTNAVNQVQFFREHVIIPAAP